MRILLLLALGCTGAPDPGEKNGDPDTAGGTDTADDSGGADCAHTAESEDCATDADDDCDGLVNDDDLDDLPTWWADADGDGYGLDAYPAQACAAPEGYAAHAGDCDDGDAIVNPGEDEHCDGVDNDCDASTAEEGVATAFADAQGTNPISSWGRIQVAIGQGAALVRVCPGTYAEAVEIDGDLVLASRDGADTTVIDASGTGSPAIRVLSGEVGIQGFTVTGGYAEYFGGGIDALLYGDGAVDIREVVVEANEGEYGAGVALDASGGATLTDAVVRGNIADEGGGGIYVSGAVTLTNVEVSGNVAEYAGGLYVYDDAVVLATGVSVEGNAAEWGAGVYVASESTITLTGSRVVANLAESHAGGAYVGSLGDSDNVLVSVGTDWGSGDEDNSPDDVYLDYDSFWTGFGAGETFTCDGDAGTCE